MSDVALLPAADSPAVLIPKRNRKSLTAWLSLYMKINGEACAEATRVAKMRDLEMFLDYFSAAAGSDEKNLWTRLRRTGERTGTPFSNPNRTTTFDPAG